MAYNSVEQTTATPFVRFSRPRQPEILFKIQSASVDTKLFFESPLIPSLKQLVAILLKHAT